MGSILDVDLTKGKWTSTPLDEDIATQYLGGAGYACAKLLPLISKETDPLGPDNILFFMTGPLTATIASSTGRMVACAKSPYTGIWGEANSCMDICVQMKKAGFDGIMVRGVAKTPVYLYIKDDKIELRDATKYWGKGIFETEKTLIADDPGSRAKILAIGPAGENLVKYAMIGGSERALGRTGMGAVMGSKKLKAVMIQGSKKVEVADQAGLLAQAKENNQFLGEHTLTQIFKQLGTAGSLDMYNLNGEMPVGYFRKPGFDQFDNISGATMMEKYQKGTRACFSCPIGCGRRVQIGENSIGLPPEIIEGPEYETLAGFGALMLNGDLQQIIKCNYMCNDLGLDTISASSTIALLMDLKDQGKISNKDLDGMDLKWGDMNTVTKLLEKISTRQGIGNLLAEGSNTVGKKFGVSDDQIASCGGVEVTYHDMRSQAGMAAAYGISPHYGGSHNSCDMYMNSLGLIFEDIGIGMAPAKENTPEVGVISAKVMAYRALYSAAIMCVFANPVPATLANFLKCVTGLPIEVKDLMPYSERILAIKRLFSLKMGYTPSKYEKIPKILITPLPESGQQGFVPDVEMIYENFYKTLDWDRKTGWPSAAKIAELGLEKYAKF